DRRPLRLATGEVDAGVGRLARPSSELRLFSSEHASQPLPETWRSCLNSLPGKETAQVIGQRSTGDITLLWLPGQGFQADPFQILGNPGRPLPQGRDGLLGVAG